MRRVLPLAALACLGAAASAPIALRPPCAGCVVQNYADLDPGPGVKDHQCRGRSYPGHDGTDFRAPSLAARTAVAAAAAGTVLRARDGVADGARGAGQECGNGLVIDHGGGWETQYCHLARGSVAVRPGDRVAAGAPLGRIGLSGDTEFPHVHLTVRRDGKWVDPFASGAAAGACGGGRSLWTAAPAYRRGEVLVAGFATGPVSMAAAQATGAEQAPRPTRDGPALVGFVQAIGLEAGDVQRLALVGPDGRTLAENRAAPLERDKAQYILFAGKRTPPGGWPAGRYRVTYAVERGGRAAVTGGAEIVLR